MPYRSKKQRAYMHLAHPDIAERWDDEYGGKIVPSSKTRRERTQSKKSKKRKNKRNMSHG